MLLSCLEIPIIAITPNLLFLDKTFDVLRTVFFAVSFMHLFITNHREKRFSMFLFSVFILFFVEFIVTILNNGNIKTMFMCFAVIWTACYFLTYYFIAYKKATCCIICNYLLLICGGNIVTQLFLNNGVYSIRKTYWVTHYYLLGGENNSITFSLCCVCFCLILAKLYNLKFYLFASILPTITTILCDSATSLVGIVLFWGLYIIDAMFSRRSEKQSRMKVHIMILFTVIATLFCLFSSEISMFSFLINGVLGKDLTFTGRTEIWKYTMNSILEKPIFGHGLLPVDELYRIITASHQHNYYLHILFQGGIFCFSLFIYIIRITIRQITVFNVETTKMICTITMFCFLIIFIVESYDENLYMLPFYILLAFFNTLNLDLPRYEYSNYN